MIPAKPFYVKTNLVIPLEIDRNILVRDVINTLFIVFTVSTKVYQVVVGSKLQFVR